VWEVHRKRVGIEGYVFKRVEYEVERELSEQELTEKELLAGSTQKSQWKDMDVNVSYIDNAQVRIGRFKIPFGLDELTSDSRNDFPYRSLGANYLAPSRDTGVMVHGRFFKRGLNYWSGVFRHDGDNARSKKIRGGNETFATRVTGTPLRTLNTAVFGGLELGAAFAVSAVSDDWFAPNGLRGRTILTHDTFYEPVYVNGHRRRWEADVDWTIGPASARSEFTWVTDDRLRQGMDDEDLPAARARSWYIAGSWILTGEPKTRPVKAANEFLNGGLGAVEVTGRYERLWFDSVGRAGANVASRDPRAEQIVPSGDTALTIGMNWTLNRWIRVQVSGIREQVEDRNPIAHVGAFWSRVVRFQFEL
jgi:phosphate-selective porin OprO/OprP